MTQLSFLKVSSRKKRSKTKRSNYRMVLVHFYQLPHFIKIPAHSYFPNHDQYEINGRKTKVLQPRSSRTFFSKSNYWLQAYTRTYNTAHELANQMRRKRKDATKYLKGSYNRCTKTEECKGCKKPRIAFSPVRK